MAETGDRATPERAQAWAEEQVHLAVREFQRRDILRSAFLEAKPAWASPFKVVIGMIREHGGETGFFWTIGGEVPCDFIASSVAGTPREAARHFALKWQLDAARQRDSDAGSGEPARLEAAAEHLYALVREDSLWVSGDPGTEA